MIIALNGYARSGKDTIGQLLVENYDFTRVSFGDKVREFALAVDPIVGYDNEDVRLSEIVRVLGWESAKAMPEVRRLLQNIGTEAAQKVFWPSIWVDAIFGPDPHPMDYFNRKIVVTDFRFPHEGATLKRLQGYTVRVIRPTVYAVNHHESETALLDAKWKFDLEICNTETLAELSAKVDTMIRSLNAP